MTSPRPQPNQPRRITPSRTTTMSLRHPSLRPVTLGALNPLPLHTHQTSSSRFLTTTTTSPLLETSTSTPEQTPAPSLPPRWLSDIRSRIGKCIFWGLSHGQLEKAGSIMKVIARDWRELVVGSEGFLTGKGREGLRRHEISWGQMDSMVCTSILETGQMLMMETRHS